MMGPPYIVEGDGLIIGLSPRCARGEGERPARGTRCCTLRDLATQAFDAVIRACSARQPSLADSFPREEPKNRLIKRLTELGYDVQLAPYPCVTNITKCPRFL
jgi:hypothetical protein